MSNLIPPTGRTSLKREYLVRLLSVYAQLMTVVFFALTALSVPTYVLVNTQLQSTSYRSTEEGGAEDSFREAEAVITDANELLAQLGAPQRFLSATKILDEIRAYAVPGITFETYQIKEGGEAKKPELIVQVQGVADSRTTLAALKLSLESSPLFERAEIPISDLARDAELPFVISLTLVGTVVSQPNHDAS